MTSERTSSPPAEQAASGHVPAPDRIDRALLTTAAVVVLGAVMSILDTTVVNVAINTLARDFATSLTTIQWIATGYTLALATVIPLTAWGANRFGTKRVYVVSIVLFVLGSVLSGLAWNATTLIVFRVLQGLGGGMLMPVGMIILTRAAGANRIGRVMAVIGVPMLLGPVLGPVLGGWLVDAYSWRLIFYINVPIGAIALLLSLRVLPRDTGLSKARLDYVGVALLSPSLALLIYGFAESSSLGGFGHAQALVPAIVGAALLATFVWHALRVPDPLVDLRLFRNRVFSGSVATMVLVIIAVFGGQLLLPLYLQIVRGESALNSGLLLVPQGIGAMLAMPLAGQLADRTGVGRIVPVGLVLVAGSFLWMTGLGADTSFVTLGVVLFFMGLGMGLTMMPSFTGALQTLRRRSIPNASTTLNITQQVGASVGTAVLTVILANVMTGALGGGPAASGGGIGDIAKLPPAVFAALKPKIAAAFGQTFWWAFAFVVVAFVVALVVLPKRKPAPVDDPDDDVSDALPGPMLMH